MISLKQTIKAMFNSEHNVSALQMSLTIIQVTALILSNIVVVKTIDLFGISFFANSCAILTFPITYVLSDVFSEVYGYRWSRVSGTWAVLGTVGASLLFTVSIMMHGNEAFTNQEAFVAILGNSPKIAFASALAFWIGDVSDDFVFAKLKEKMPSDKMFGVRAWLSSICGKYIDQIIFTFIGLSFLPMKTKILMVISSPIAQLIFEALFMPITHKVAHIVRNAEQKRLA